MTGQNYIFKTNNHYSDPVKKYNLDYNLFTATL